MDKESFLEILKRSSPNEVREYLMKKGKHKKVCPIILYPDNTDEKVGDVDGESESSG